VSSGLDVITLLASVYSCMECIISEQLDKLKATLHEIEFLTSASHKAVSLIEDIIESDKVKIPYNTLIM